MLVIKGLHLGAILGARILGKSHTGVIQGSSLRGVLAMAHIDSKVASHICTCIASKPNRTCEKEGCGRTRCVYK